MDIFPTITNKNITVMHMPMLIVSRRSPFNLPAALTSSRLNEKIYLTAGTLRRQGSGMDLKSKSVLEICSYIH